MLEIASHHITYPTPAVPLAAGRIARNARRNSILADTALLHHQPQQRVHPEPPAEQRAP